jgi:hypothetical protein
VSELRKLIDCSVKIVRDYKMESTDEQTIATARAVLKYLGTGERPYGHEPCDIAYLNQAEQRVYLKKQARGLTSGQLSYVIHVLAALHAELVANE